MEVQFVKVLCVLISIRYGAYLPNLGSSWTTTILCHLLSLLDIYMALRLMSDMGAVSLATPNRVSLIQQCSVLFNLSLLWGNHNNNGLTLLLWHMLVLIRHLFYLYFHNQDGSICY